MKVKVEAQKKPAYEEYVFKRDLKDDSELPLKPSPQGDCSKEWVPWSKKPDYPWCSAKVVWWAAEL